MKKKNEIIIHFITVHKSAVYTSSVIIIMMKKNAINTQRMIEVQKFERVSYNMLRFVMLVWTGCSDLL